MEEQNQDENSSMESIFKEESKDESEGLVKKKYTIEEMDALRFVRIDYQRQRFEQVYWGLEPSVREELDSISVHDSGKNNTRNRNRNRNKKRNKQRNKEAENKDAGAIVGEEIEANQFGAEEQINNLKNKKCSDYDISDDDKYDGILKPAFLVEGEPDFESGPPLDGLEYLRRVRWEANQIPDVNIAKLNLSEICSEQTPYMPKVAELPKCPPNLFPSKQWQDSFLSQFSDLRKLFSELEISINQDEPEDSARETVPNLQTMLTNYILSLRSSFQLDTSSDQLPLNSSSQLDTFSDQPLPLQSSPQLDTSIEQYPLQLSFQLDISSDQPLPHQSSFQLEFSSDESLPLQSSPQLDTSGDQSVPLQSSTQLETSGEQSIPLQSSPELDTSIEQSKQTSVPNLHDLIKTESITRASTLRNYIDMVQSFETLSNLDCLWLFALCVSVDEPLNANMYASLRSLLRKCLGIIGEKKEMDDEVAMVLVIVVICGRYFGQFDNN